MRRIVLCGLLILCSGWLEAQVVVSRRTYAQRGRSFAQIWHADSGTYDFRQLTHSARDHSEPVCSRDGKAIYFVSDRDAERSRNSYLNPGEREVWAYERQTGEERLVWSNSGDNGVDLIGTTADDAVLIRDKSGVLRLVPTGRGWAAEPAPRGASDYTHDIRNRHPELSLIESALGAKYDAASWSPDGKRIAAFADGNLAILDAATRKEIERVSLPKPDWPRQDIVWSPNGKSLLVGIYGENAGSGDPQSDYFLLNLATRALTPSLTARSLLWLQGDTVLYLRPFETTPLAPSSPHSVWTSQLAVYDLSSHKDTQLTSGLVLNDDLAVCDR